MVWQGAAVRELRQRLGWSRAEMARRLGVTLDSVTAWEENNTQPSDHCIDQLNFMQHHVNSHSDVVARKPVAEALMSRLNLSQIHSEQVETSLETAPSLFLAE